MDYSIEKRTLSNGWSEIRIVTLRPTATPDFSYQGNEAREHIAKLFLSGAAGICDVMVRPHLSEALADVYNMLSSAFAFGAPRGQ